MNKQRIMLGDLPVDDCSTTIVSRIVSLSKSNKKSIITYLNPYVFIKTRDNPKARSLIKESDLVYPDGWGIVFASRILGFDIDSRITTSDFFIEFCTQASKEGLRIGFLGGKENTSKQAIETLKKGIKSLNLTYINHGYFSEADQEKIIKKITSEKLDLLIVGLGTPKQEEWVFNNRKNLHVRCIWTVGSLMEYFSGKPRAPKWLGDHYFEWLFRLIIEPKRLVRRYTVEHMKFIYWTLKQYIKTRTR